MFSGSRLNFGNFHFVSCVAFLSERVSAIFREADLMRQRLDHSGLTAANKPVATANR